MAIFQQINEKEIKYQEARRQKIWKLSL